MILVVAALVAIIFPIFLVSALSPMISDDVGLDEAVIGVAMAVYMLAGATVSVPLGRMIDRRGATVALRTGLVIVSVIGIGITVTVRGGGALIAWMILGGISIGFVDNGSARVISAVTPLRRQGLAFGIKEAAIPAAAMLAGTIVPILGDRVGWRVGFVGAAMLAAAVAFIVPRGIDQPQNVHDRAAPNRIMHDATGTESTSSGDVSAATAARGALVGLALAAGLGGAAASAAATFLVSSSVDAGFSPGAAGTLLAVASAAGISVRVLLGVAADRMRDSELAILVTALLLGAVGIIGLAFGSGTTLVLAAILALGAGWGWTGLMFFAAVRMVPAAPARAASTVLVGLAGGGGAGPLLFGPLVTSAGFTPAWIVTAMVMVIAASLVVAVIGMQHRFRARSVACVG